MEDLLLQTRGVGHRDLGARRARQKRQADDARVQGRRCGRACGAWGLLRERRVRAEERVAGREVLEVVELLAGRRGLDLGEDGGAVAADGREVRPEARSELLEIGVPAVERRAAVADVVVVVRVLRDANRGVLAAAARLVLTVKSESPLELRIVRVLGIRVRPCAPSAATCRRGRRRATRASTGSVWRMVRGPSASRVRRRRAERGPGRSRPVRGAPPGS